MVPAAIAFRPAVRKRRNEIGVYEAQEIYEIHDENFPVVHGEKSAMILLRSGLYTFNECATSPPG